MKMKTVRKLT